MQNITLVIPVDKVKPEIDGYEFHNLCGFWNDGISIDSKSKTVKFDFESDKIEEFKFDQLKIADITIDESRLFSYDTNYAEIKIKLKNIREVNEKELSKFTTLIRMNAQGEYDPYWVKNQKS